MNNFNKELTNKVKLFYSENAQDLIEEKYSFIQYVFSNIESTSSDNIEICEEEFESLDCNIDASYYDEDSQVYNIYLAIYSDKIDDNAFLTKDEYLQYYNKVYNFISKAISGNINQFDESSFTYCLATDIHNVLKSVEIVVNIVSNYNIPQSYKIDEIKEINNYSVSFRTYDFSDLESKFNQITNLSNELICFNRFGKSLDAICITRSQDFDVYLFSMKGLWLANLYKEDSERLLEPNVRSYLKRTSRVNAGILETVKSSPDEFVSFNNGISAVATGISIDNDYLQNTFCVRISKIENFQIVNGGQTTATLYECLKDKLIENINEVVVPVKLTVVKNTGNADNFIRNISLFSNTQTAIKKSDPPSNLPYYIQIKKLSGECLSSTGSSNYLCYFERTNGEYVTELRRNNSSKKFINTNPKDKKFDKIDLARAINCWEQLPYITCQGKEKSFSLFNDTVKNQMFIPDETYFKQAYAVVVLYKKVDNIAKKLKITIRSNVVAYICSLVSYLYDKELDLDYIWDKKDLPDYLTNLVISVINKVHELIVNSPNEYPEPRMWARKEKCWDLIKGVKTSVSVIKTGNKINFFRDNDALIYISNENNFYNSLTWMKLLLWDSKFKFLTKNQTSIVKMMRSNAGKESVSLTKKQIDFLKDIFISAVKKGYIYQ